MIDLEERYTHYRKRFRAFMEARKMTNEAVAEKLDGGVHPVTISKLRTGAINLNDEWRARIADAFGIEHDLLFGHQPLPTPRPDEVRPQKRRGRPPRLPQPQSTLPMFGWAAGSVTGVETLTNEPVDEVPCPPALSDTIGAYALKTRGESMYPRYLPEDILYVNPHQTVKSGDHVVIQTQRYEGSGVETWVKRYDSENDTSVFVSQYHPPAQITFRKTEVLSIHRILSVNELF
ncbi:XRE family transcriptional regulator [Nitratireductor sp. GZWM139]|uniref:XRE family transcriptional regulator n=1 Tax=Nitratireductor sp. GZWM139 TaxID=2950541 RepID=UPI0024BEB5C6|nr:XRE family transcriptional regulator [Nitratireductor sp. GZWM139]MDJ1463361.1 hypothetical protein [Nitratireductor sp. GZWM139]